MSISASDTLAPIPSTVNARPTCAPRRYPLVNVHLQPPQRVPEQDRPDVCEHADHDEGEAHDDVPDHDREATRGRVGHDPGRRLEDEHGELHHRPDEHELERAHADLGHEVVGRHREGEGLEKRGGGLVGVPDGAGGEAVHARRLLSLGHSGREPGPGDEAGDPERRLPDRACGQSEAGMAGAV
jgi:hypothetical protein